MQAIVFILLAVVAIIATAVIYAFIARMVERSKFVKKLKMELLEMCFDWDDRHPCEESSIEWLYKELPSTRAMFFSTKPICVTSWVSDEKFGKLCE